MRIAKTFILFIIVLAGFYPPFTFAGPAIYLGWKPTNLSKDDCNARAGAVLTKMFGPVSSFSVIPTKQNGLLAQNEVTSIIVWCFPEKGMVEIGVSSDNELHGHQIGEDFFSYF